MYFRFPMRTTCHLQLIFLYLIALGKGKGKSKFHLKTTHEGPEGGTITALPVLFNLGAR